MRIIIIGCEYVGKSTLAGQISRWMIRATWGCQAFAGTPISCYHTLIAISWYLTAVQRPRSTGGTMRRSYNCRLSSRSS